jgi:hypothetical protein
LAIDIRRQLDDTIRPANEASRASELRAALAQVREFGMAELAQVLETSSWCKDAMDRLGRTIKLEEGFLGAWPIQTPDDLEWLRIVVEYSRELGLSPQANPDLNTRQLANRSAVVNTDECLKFASRYPFVVLSLGGANSIITYNTKSFASIPPTISLARMASLISSANTLASMPILDTIDPSERRRMFSFVTEPVVDRDAIFILNQLSNLKPSAINTRETPQGTYFITPTNPPLYLPIGAHVFDSRGPKEAPTRVIFRPSRPGLILEALRILRPDIFKNASDIGACFRSGMVSSDYSRRLATNFVIEIMRAFGIDHQKFLEASTERMWERLGDALEKKGIIPSAFARLPEEQLGLQAASPLKASQPLDRRRLN